MEEDSAEYLFETAKVLLSEENYEKSASMIEKAVLLRPESVLYHQWMGHIYKKSQLMMKSIKAYEIALELSNKKSNYQKFRICKQLFKLCLEFGKLDNATKIIETLLELFKIHENRLTVKKKCQLYINIALYYAYINDKAKCYEYFEITRKLINGNKSSDLDDLKKYMYYRYCWCLYTFGEYALCMEYINDCLNMKSSDSDRYDNTLLYIKALMYVDLGLYNKAVKFFTKSGEDTTNLFRIGLIHIQRNEKTKIEQILQKMEILKVESEEKYHLLYGYYLGKFNANNETQLITGLNYIHKSINYCSMIYKAGFSLDMIYYKSITGIHTCYYLLAKYYSECLNDYENAIKYFNLVLNKYKPNLVIINYDLYNIYYNVKKEYKKAFVLLYNAFKINPYIKVIRDTWLDIIIMNWYKNAFNKENEVNTRNRWYKGLTILVGQYMLQNIE